jgi:hypothetical protein
MARYESVDDAIAAATDRDIVTVVPGVEIIEGEGLLTVPEDVLP